MDIITIGEVEEAIGPLSPEEATQVAYYIKLVSRYIMTYTGVSFERVDDFELRTRTDYYGRVQLPGGPVHNVTDVQYHHNFVMPADWYWDGMVEVYGLKPRATVDITYSFGFDEIPEEIKFVAIEAVRRYHLTGDDRTVGPLRTYKVGDVTETFVNQSATGPIGSIFNNFEKMVLDDYRSSAMETMFLGFAQPTPFVVQDDVENQIFVVNE